MYVHNQGRAELESLALAEAQTCPGGPRLHPPTHPPTTYNWRTKGIRAV